MTGKTILVIDSDTETTHQIVSILEAEDYLVFTAPNRDVGLAMAKKVTPSLIFVNPSLSGASGLDLCKTIHGTEQFKYLPIVILSLFEGAMDSRYAETYGIVDSLKKPFGKEELISKTSAVLSGEFGSIRTNAFQEFPAESNEEPVEIGGADETVVMKQQPKEWQSASPKGSDTSQETLVKELSEPDEKTIAEDIPSSQKIFKFKTSIRRSGMKSRLFVPLIVALVIIVIIGAGVAFIMYKESLLPGLKPSASIPAKPVAKETTAVAPKEPEKTAAEAPASKPAVQAPDVKTEKPLDKPSVSKSPAVSVPETKVESKPTGNAYHVQIGAFKNETKAEALAKNYKSKDYEAFIKKGAGKNNETLYRVLIGKFKNNKEALSLARKIEAKEKTKAVIFKD